MKKRSKKSSPSINPIALAVSTVLAGGMLAAATPAEASPFSMTALSSGYLAAMTEGNCGTQKTEAKDAKGDEGKCGTSKEAKADGDTKGKEGKCGEGKCGANKKMQSKDGKDAEGKCGAGMEDKAKTEKGAEGKCGSAA